MASATLAASGAMPAGRRPGLPLWTIVAAGVLLGAVIAFLEFGYYRPLAPHRLGWSSLTAAFLTWSGEGVLLALALGLLERWKAPALPATGQVAAALIMGSVVGVCLWQAFIQFLLRERFGVRVFLDYVGQPVSWPATVLYHVWLVALLGGLTGAAYISWCRRTRTLGLLREAELGRERCQQALAQAKLAALQARIDPEFLFERLTRLETLYESDPPAADRLLEELIAYLRKERT